ncbi:cysteine-rich CWC family protein [Flavobacterium sp. W21_SRS_FM6]|uniref:cysteine-rich CWC family protein n=1 Tax=Flavobacterium sp. W21_SRS_FM6 TaxID=3240268 RepID=UPI003F933B5F
MSSVQVCPFCQLHNACGIDKIEQCWCVVQTIPAAMISLLPAEHQNTHCICASCAGIQC